MVDAVGKWTGVGGEDEKDLNIDYVIFSEFQNFYYDFHILREILIHFDMSHAYIRIKLR